MRHGEFAVSLQSHRDTCKECSAKYHIVNLNDVYVEPAECSCQCHKNTRLSVITPCGNCSGSKVDGKCPQCGNTDHGYRGDWKDQATKRPDWLNKAWYKETTVIPRHDTWADLRPAMRLHAAVGCWTCLLGVRPCDIILAKWDKGQAKP